MDINFNFQHNLLKLPELQELGIRSAKWLEEIIEDLDTQYEDITIPSDKFPVYSAVGFCKESIPIKYIFERDGDTIRSLYAKRATKREVINEFCAYCKK